ncbi:MAG: cell filamentation protein Fic [Omnitrophica WOR_2 bacterium RIFCSPHIGHO2_01_FULL_48_9]|nr:MAG: cell filamentation protein Fic [Omnitrophica WOR_2 bacterium RIFCSPHIGHO2_02_FULL_48_11]OGX32571.1 MAG: cell filamentation protein Fic [Omnitrophica WOR_2 bacterium RIFCSPHIGHO2_01_FULL_48_9]
MNNFEYPSGATPLDPNEMEGLKLGHITAREELNRFEQDNINETLQWLANRRKSDILTEKFVKTLHQKMFGKVWKWAGSFRKSGKNIGVDWPQISTQLHTLLQDVRYWIEHKTYSEDEIAVRFHHRLVWVHLFANGNGRHARLMTNILLEEVLKQKPFTWNVTNINIEDKVRDSYLKALRQADNHDYSMLLDFVRADWKKSNKGQ